MNKLNSNDLMNSLIKKWKQILIGTVVVCLLLVVYGYLKHRNTSEVANDPRNVLKEDEIKETETAYSIYAKALTNRDVLVHELNHSALSQMDSNSTVAITNMYVINSDVSNVYDYYTNANVFTTEERNQIIEACGFKEDTTDLDELVVISDGSYEVSNSSNKTTTIIHSTSSGKTSIKVSIYSNSEDACKTISDIVDDHFKQKSDEISASYELASTVEETDVSYVTNQQKQLVDDLTSAIKKLDEVEEPDYLTDPEISYLKSLIANDGDSEAVEEASTSFSYKKYIVVGLVGGLVVMVCLYSAMYYFSNKQDESK